jgi:predicted MFS family arabinose efflux permease
MPFGSAFAINNLHVTYQQLPVLFMIAGVSSLIVMPLIGRLSDKVSKFKIFAGATVWMMVMCVLYTNLSVTPFWLVVIFNILMMMGIMSRMVPSSALTSAVPDMEDRGAFMSINASMQQIAGGVAAAVAGLIVVQQSKGSPLQHYDTVGYVIIGISACSILLMGRVNNMINRKIKDKPAAVKLDDVVISEGF